MRNCCRQLSAANKRLFWTALIFTFMTGTAYFFVVPQNMGFDPAGLIQCSFLGLLSIVGFSLTQLYKHRGSWTVLPQNLLITAITLIFYFPFNFILVRGINPNAKSSTQLPGDIALSPGSSNLSDIEFNEGQTVLSMFKFCLVMIISQSVFKALDFVTCTIMVVVACPFYLFSSLIMLVLSYSDPAGTIQIFAFSGVFSFTAEMCLHFRLSNIVETNPNNRHNPSGFERILILLGTIIFWTLIPFIIETRTISTDFNTKVRGVNPMAWVQQQNTYTALLSCVLGILLREASEQQRTVQIETVVYSLLCSSVTICTAGEYIQSSTLTTCVAILCGYLFDSLFIYMASLPNSDQIHERDRCSDKFSRSARIVFRNSGMQVMGFGLAASAGCLIALIMALLNRADWINLRWDAAGALDSARTLLLTPGIIVGVFAITVAIALFAGFIAGLLISVLSNRRPNELPYQDFQREQLRIDMNEAIEPGYD